jgi:REP element-mobilizing transposase RayT
MPRKSRNTALTEWMHIIIRGINRENLFYDKEDYERFISTMKRYRRETNYELAAGCCMSNHVHLLINPRNNTPGKLLQKILVSYSAYYNKKYDRVGHVFQDRFRSESINDYRTLVIVARYIYRNPEKAGICKAKEYPYTYLPLDGPLSEFFASQQQFTDFLETDNADRCLEYDSKSSYKDDEAIKIIINVSGENNPQNIQGYERKARDRILHKLKLEGLTVRQISRLTGLNRNIVQRA